LYAFSVPSLQEPWQHQALLYMLRMVYGWAEHQILPPRSLSTRSLFSRFSADHHVFRLSSFPFVFWKVPGHLHVFTKTIEKGYRLGKREVRFYLDHDSTSHWLKHPQMAQPANVKWERKRKWLRGVSGPWRMN
jgi:hypothetical protein